MTFNNVNDLNLLGKTIFLKCRNDKFVKIYISGVIKHGDNFYFITKSTKVNDKNESVVRQVKVDYILNGLTTGKYVKTLPENVTPQNSSRLTVTDNSFYKTGYSEGRSSISPVIGNLFSCGGGC